MNITPSINLPELHSVWPENQTPFASPDDGVLPRLSLYLPSEEYRTGQTVLILPGGGYGMVSSPKEGHRPAQYLNAHGVAAAVLEYRHAPQRHPVPLCDTQRAIRLVRQWAGQNGLDSGQVGIMGFSAGGHLAGSLATQAEVPESRAGDAADSRSHFPDFTILLYPVVSLTAPFSHFGSRDNLLGTPCDPTLAEKLSIEKAITADTSPMFIAHAQDDPAVPVANALTLTAALTEKNVKAELHVYPEGGHGFGMAANHSWGPALLNWLKNLPQ
ncbi:alpha/beta hydrolase [Kiritimatiellaeota bacterium B1221]|nr:alpha/beta hydrolase [Kiritimatiellaeota bacterium B1221]